jgi:SAM-dependent methyltransferase
MVSGGPIASALHPELDIRKSATRVAATIARAFLRGNKRAAFAVERHLPQAKTNLHAEYTRTVGEYLSSLPPGAVVVDVGGGKKCDFARHRAPGSGVKLVAVDVSAEELAHNVDVDEKVVADATQRLPFGDQEVDIIASHSVIEHLRDSEAFVRESARVLKHGGFSINMLPNRFAPFSVANRLMPRSLSRQLLRILIPGSEGKLGFPAFYDRTDPSAMREIIAQSGLEVVELRVGYYQAEYFDFFLPLYLLSAAYEIVASSLRLQDLAANMLIVARRP